MSHTKTLFKIIVPSLAFFAMFFVYSAPARAATFNVASGNDENTDNTSCAVSEAIENINDQATTNTDCSPSGAYGTDDTINLPAGTITLTADLPQITRSVSITGHDMSTSIIDGDGAYIAIYCHAAGQGVSLYTSDFKVVGFKESAISAIGCNLMAEKIEADGTNGVAGVDIPVNGGVLAVSDIYDISINITDMYVHDISVDADNDSAFGVNTVVSELDGSLDLNVENLTAESLLATGSGIQTVAAGVGFQLLQPNSGFTGSVRNSTFSNISATQSLAYGVRAVAAISTAGNTSDSYTIENNTFNDIDGQSAPLTSAAIGAFGFAEDSASIVINSSNNFISEATGCYAADIGSLFGASGVTNVDIVTSGGNLTDDTSCSSYFNHATDQNNVSGLGSTLSALADNGGYVPTMALKAGSTAIDAGVAIPSVTTDARGVNRPQCSGYDSGAFERSTGCPTNTDADTVSDSTENAAPNNGDGNNDGTLDRLQSHVTSLPIPSGSNAGTYVTIVSPSGSNISASAIQQVEELASQDSGFSYPLGLIDFTAVGLEEGGTIPIQLYFHTDEPAENFIPRKYSDANQTYKNLAVYTLESIPLASNTALRLSYNITDGGDLDDDGEANGTIVDPVGLAMANLAETGRGVLPFMALAILLSTAGFTSVIWQIKQRT